jgi:putative signal transducing protein
LFCKLAGMSEFITIMTFDDLPNCHIVKGRLETEGIKCYVQDEYTIQSKPGVADLYGGIKLQIREDDVEKALQILKEVGYYKEEQQQRSKFSNSVDKFLGKLPFIERFPLQIKLLAIAFFILSIAIVVTVVKNAK